MVFIYIPTQLFCVLITLLLLALFGERLGQNILPHFVIKFMHRLGCGYCVEYFSFLTFIQGSQ